MVRTGRYPWCHRTSLGPWRKRRVSSPITWEDGPFQISILEGTPEGLGGRFWVTLSPRVTRWTKSAATTRLHHHINSSISKGLSPCQRLMKIFGRNWPPLNGQYSEDTLVGFQNCHLVDGVAQHSEVVSCHGPPTHKPAMLLQSRARVVHSKTQHSLLSSTHDIPTQCRRFSRYTSKALSIFLGSPSHSCHISRVKLKIL